MLTSEQITAVENLIRDVGKNCILRHFQNRDKITVDYKSTRLDPVTIADQEAEELLKTGLLKILPDSLFVGEENYAEDPDILKHLEQNDQPVWLVDPIDGTFNFVEDTGDFGVMCALIDDGGVVASWFYEVLAGRLTSMTGEGIAIDGQTFTTPGLNKTPTGRIGYKFHQYPAVTEAIQNLTGLSVPVGKKVPSIVFYPQLLKGELDFAVLRLTYPWDHWPGIGLLEGQGFVARRWDGEPIGFTDLYDGLVVARNEDIWARVQEQIVEPLTKVPEIMSLGRL